MNESRGDENIVELKNEIGIRTVKSRILLREYWPKALENRFSLDAFRNNK